MNEFTITRLGHQGDGIAEGPLYAPLTLPGEVITAAQDGQKLGDIRILTPSPDRVAPPCRHFKSCGGCQLQHVCPEAIAAQRDGRARGMWTIGRSDATTSGIVFLDMF